MAVTLSDMRRLLDPIRLKIRLIVSRAVVRAVDDAGGLQIIQVTGLPGEVLDGVEHFQNYGFTSVPLPGAEMILGFVGGYRSHGVGLVVDDRRHRKKGMQPGETAQFSDEGDSIHLKRGKIIAVTSGGEVTVDAPKVALTGTTEVTIDGAKITLTGTGEVKLDGATVAIVGTTTIESRVFLDHKHRGVISGGSESGGVV